MLSIKRVSINLLPPGLRALCIKYNKLIPIMRSELDPTVHDICSAFNFGSSPEGIEFWSDIYDNGYRNQFEKPKVKQL